jgi:type I restriction enzyme S subunit
MINHVFEEKGIMGFALKFQVYVKMKELKIKFRWETEFKETEIGEIPRDWEVKKLGDMATIKTGKTDVKDAVEDGEYPLFDRSDQIKRSNKYLFDTEAVIVPGEGKDFTPRYYKGKFDLHQRTYAIFDFKELNGKYLFFAMHILRHALRDFAVGSTVESLRLPILKNLDIPYPPLPEQSRIATVLSWFDDLIEVKKRQNEILEKTAMAIFKSWFIDFEPFRDGEFVYSEELGKEIPKGWEVDKTIRLIDYNPSVSIEEGKVFPFVEMKDVSTNSLACDFSFKTFTGSGVKYFGGDTLMARITPSLEHGKTAFVWFISEKEKGFGSTEFFVLHPKKSYLKEFVYLLAKSNDFREVAINSMSGTSGRQRADINALKNYLIPIPPSHILQSFHSLVEPLFQKIILNQKQIMTLRKIRDTLLPLLVFGKLRVEEV